MYHVPKAMRPKAFYLIPEDESSGRNSMPSIDPGPNKSDSSIDSLMDWGPIHGPFESQEEAETFLGKLSEERRSLAASYALLRVTCVWHRIPKWQYQWHAYEAPSNIPGAKKLPEYLVPYESFPDSPDEFPKKD